MTVLAPGPETPPGSQRRAVSRFKPGIVRAVVGEVLAVALTVVAWAGLRAFDRSLGIGDPGPQIARVIEIVLAGATIVVPAYGARAIARSLSPWWASLR